ncbi:hypothetical protein PanWU01x14_353860 [Parasponia andersonii]|uniref:Transmembrane protein n=1 Tax=Parasponia andersonii TaxID=3476 RepID=A0A2P5A9V1_PARAD|nr:hypothetical protein PanWU01x14_353860 [Parasponia andersonii]
METLVELWMRSLMIPSIHAVAEALWLWWFWLLSSMDEVVALLVVVGLITLHPEPPAAGGLALGLLLLLLLLLVLVLVLLLVLLILILLLVLVFTSRLVVSGGNKGRPENPQTAGDWYCWWV